MAVPGTLTGFGTIALAAATFALLRQDQIEKRASAERNRRDQASRVHLGSPEQRHVGGANNIESSIFYRARVVNASQFPVHNVRVFATLSEQATATLVDGAAVRDRIGQSPAISRLLPSHRGYVLPLPMEWRSELDFFGDGPPDIWVAFTDITGTRWLRDPQYRLEDISGIWDWYAIRFMRDGNWLYSPTPFNEEKANHRRYGKYFKHDADVYRAMISEG